MAVLIVGADRLGNIEDQLRSRGSGPVIHWDGRKKSYSNRIIPHNVEKIIIFCDFISHRAMMNIKKQAKIKGMPIQYSRRSLIGIQLGTYQ